MILRVRPAERWEAEYVGENLRAEDAREVITATGAAPCVAVLDALAQSRKCFAIRPVINDIPSRYPVAIYGVADDPRSPGFGNVWLLATPSVRQVSLALMKASEPLLIALGHDYPNGLHCAVDARNNLHLRWLRCCGFVTVGECAINGHTFIHAVRPTTNTIIH